MRDTKKTMLQSGQWFETAIATEKAKAPNDGTPLLGMLLGIAIGGLLIYAQRYILGSIVLTVAIGIGAASFAFPTFHAKWSHWMRHLGHFLGVMIGYMVLVPLFFVGFTMSRIFQYVLGQDPMGLRSRSERTFWLPSDEAKRKRRFSGTMFATEPRVRRRGPSLIGMAIILASLLFAGELFLRSRGYGNAVLYQPDSIAGLYPAPNQDVTRMGGTVQTNRYGMRAPDFEDVKADNCFRILMLGDSTLYGGQYIDQPELYARLLQQQLSEKSKLQIEVWNMGTNGWGPFNKLGYVNKFGVFDADLCIVCMPLDDIRRPFLHFWDTPYFHPAAPPRLAYEEVLWHLNWRQRQQVYRRNNPSTGDMRDQQLQDGIDCYLALAETIRRKGCEVTFEILPTREVGLGNPEREANRTLLREFQVQLSDFEVAHPTGLFEETVERDRIYHDPIHLDIVGHQLYADYLASRVESLIVWKSRSAESVVGSEP